MFVHCVRRQRVWGTFIPVIYDLEGEPVISEELVARYCTVLLIVLYCTVQVPFTDQQ